MDFAQGCNLKSYSCDLPDPFRGASFPAAKIKRYLGTSRVPDLTAEEILTIDDAEEGLHATGIQRVNWAKT